jgi:hypothetical protein
VSAASDRDEEIVFARKPHGGDDVGRSAALRDERRTPVDLAVPHFAGLVERRVVALDQIAREVGA